MPPRLNTAAPNGWLRLMPALLDGTMGFKAMNLNSQTGVRYLLLLYEAETGELSAILDAAIVTRLRTAALTAIACETLQEGPVPELGLFGSGYEAESHVDALKMRYPELERLVVHSPRAERRESFAARVGERHGIEVEAVADPETAAQVPVVCLATKAKEQVVQDEWFPPGTLVLSIGSTRLDLRELDARMFARCEHVLCDSPEQLARESGDVRAALEAGYLREDQLIRVADVVSGSAEVRRSGGDLRIFKSVGTALQDLAVGRALLQGCADAGRGLDLGTFPEGHS